MCRYLNYLQDPPDWTDILTHFRGSELQNYFTKILEDDLKAIIKPQYVDQIPKAVKVWYTTQLAELLVTSFFIEPGIASAISSSFYIRENT